MVSKCGKCGSLESQASALAVCDNCSSKLCQECVDLTATEFRSVVLKKRSIIYYCRNCRDHMESRVAPDILQLLPGLIDSACKAYFDGFAGRLDSFKDDISKMCSNIRCDLESVRRLVKGGLVDSSGDSSDVRKSQNKAQSGELQPSVKLKKGMSHQPRERGVSVGETRRAIQQVNNQLLVDRQTEVMDGILNLNTHVGVVNHTSRSDAEDVALDGGAVVHSVVNDGFSVVTRRKRKNRSDVIGSKKLDNSEGSLIGADRRMWLYVGRTSAQTNEQVVLDYLSLNTGIKDFEVTKLPSRGIYPSFKVSAPFSVKEKLQDPDFWPSGVLTRRFNFRRSDFLSGSNAAKSAEMK